MKLIVCLSVIVGAVGSEEYKMVTSIQPLEAKWWHESTSGECYGVDTGNSGNCVQDMMELFLDKTVDGEPMAPQCCP